MKHFALHRIPLKKYVKIILLASKSGEYTVIHSLMDVSLSVKSTYNVYLCLFSEYPSFRKQIRMQKL